MAPGCDRMSQPAAGGTPLSCPPMRALRLPLLLTFALVASACQRTPSEPLTPAQARLQAQQQAFEI